MSDRFKFRVWCDIKDEMYYNVYVGREGVIIPNYQEMVNPLMLNKEPHSFVSLRFMGKHLMQCTGLRDKNEKLIYEGDLCKAKKPNSYLNGVYEIAWHQKKGRWYYKGQPDYKDLYQVGCEGNLSCEVIGNVYENPELLERE